MELPVRVTSLSATMLPLLCIVSTERLIDWACKLAPPSTRFVFGAKYRVGTSTVSVLPFGNTTDLLTKSTTSSLRFFCSDSVNPLPNTID